MTDQDDVKISQLTALLLLDDGSYIPVIQTLNGTLTTLKVDVSTFAGKIAEGTTYTNLTTTSKNLVGAINEVNAQTGGKFIIVETLPTEDIDLKAIYLILKTGSEPNNVYDEYLYINNAWELIGTTAVDLSNYYTKSQTDTEIEQAITTDTYSGLQTTSKNPIGAINEVNTKASQFDNMTATASGSIATFDNGGDDIPVSEFECEIVAQQASGTPTPDNPLAITGFSQADIPVSGKNLVDETQFVQGSISGTGEDTVSYTRLRSPLTMVKPNTAYAFATNSALLVFEIHEYDKNGTWFQYTNINNTSGTITTTANTGYIKILIRNSTNTPVTVDELTTFQMEKGNVASAYAPYISPNLYTVAFGQTIYGGRLIYANGQWSIEATHVDVDLGALSWTSTTLGIQNVWITSLPTGVKGYDDNYVPTNIWCEQYAPTSVDNMYSGISGVSLRTSQNRIYCSRTDLNEPQGKLIAELATPTIIPITSSTRVKTISGDNNIYSNTGDCELKYFTNKADSLAELIKAFVL